MRSLPWMTGAIGVVVGAAGALTFARAPEASPNADAAAAAEDAGPPAPMRDAGLAATLDAGAPDAGPAPIDAFAFAPILDVRTTAERVAVVPGWRYTVCGMATVADENADGGTPLREARLGGITGDAARRHTPASPPAPHRACARRRVRRRARPGSAGGASCKRRPVRLTERSRRRRRRPRRRRARAALRLGGEPARRPRHAGGVRATRQRRVAKDHVRLTAARATAGHHIRA